MKVIIVGCGKIGSAITESLLKEKHDVVVIDNSPSVIARANDSYDVMTVCGNGSSYEVLQQANIEQADLFVAVTSSDELNMLACFLAKQLGVPYTVARVRETEYAGEGLQFLRDKLDLSMVINPERLTAESLFDKLKLPANVKAETFEGKRVCMLELEIKADSPLAGEKLLDLRQNFPMPFVICTVLRGNNVSIPNGETVLREGDVVGVILAKNDVHKFAKLAGVAQKQAKDVMIVGGSYTAYYLAEVLTQNNTSAIIIEKNADRCREISETLNGVTVICGDGSNRELLAEEGLTSTDALVTLTNHEEQNLVISFYATSQNVPKVATHIDSNELVDVAQKLGLTNVITTKRIVADVITRYARAIQNTLGSNIVTLYSIFNGKAEALEFDVALDFPSSNIPLKDLSIKKGSIIASITRGNTTIIPTGHDVIIPGDKVIVVSLNRRFADLSEVVS